MSISSEHPRLDLLFFVAGDFDDKLSLKLERFLAGIEKGQKWVIDPPLFVIEHQQADTETSIPILGGLLRIYSALPPWKLPADLDRQHLNEVNWLVEKLCEFSAREQIIFEFELENDFVGLIENGTPDRTLQEGLIGEWRRGLDKREKR